MLPCTSTVEESNCVFSYIQDSVEDLWILDSSDLPQLVDQQVTLKTHITFISQQKCFKS